MPIKLISVAFLALLTAGCVTSSNDGPSSTPTTGETLLHITAQGVGTLNSDTTYSGKAIEQALPDFTTQPVQTAVEGRTVWTTGAFHEGFQVVLVLKGKNGKIGAVHGVTPRLSGPNGERIGMSLRQVGTSIDDCRVGADLWRGMAICSARGTENIKLIYAIPGYEGPFDRLPPPEMLTEARLQRIVWTPLD